MFTTSLVLLSDQMALQRSADIVANNIANSSTTGFKRQGIQFETYVSRPAPKQSTSFVFDRATFRDTTQGVISQTGNPLDLAIQGEGYFQVQTPQGVQYTRNGAFSTDNQGQLVTSTGYPVLGDGGQPISMPEDVRDITVSGDGYITAQTGTGTSRAQLGKLGVVTFDINEAVTPTSGSMLTTTQVPVPVTGNVIVQGAIENSNVKPVTEITNLIKIQRAYEQASNMVGQENARLSNAIDKLAQTTA
ncbi:MAG: flagellar basal-body rod protein FlgF [Alphaproteobacteria bacterium]|nr:flagellar basal-body rod protein FlgF [Alphaproteobacteria bacterium]